VTYFVGSHLIEPNDLAYVQTFWVLSLYALKQLFYLSTTNVNCFNVCLV